MTITLRENTILTEVRSQLMTSNIVKIPTTFKEDILIMWCAEMVPWNDELVQVKLLICATARKSTDGFGNSHLIFSKYYRELVLDTLENLNLYDITELDEDEQRKFKRAVNRQIEDYDKQERKLLKAGKDHNMVEVIIDDEVNFKMQISKGDKLTLEITDQGVTKVSLSAPETKGE